MNYEEAARLCELNGQQQLLAFYDELSDNEKKELLSQIEDLDFSLVDLVKDGVKENPKGLLAPLGAVSVDEIKKNQDKYFTIGAKALKEGKVGCVLLAGGMGTRLGFDQPKGMFNIGVNKDLYIFEQLIRNLFDVVKQVGAYIPLFIMTSDKNNDATVSFFEEKEYFGYPKEYVSFFKQEMAPAMDYEGAFYLEQKSKLATSPNGNGGWFSSMLKAGLGQVMHDKNIEWLNVFAVDNVLQRIADPLFVGATIDSGCVSGAKVVRKADANEKVGVLCLEDGKPSIVEYYEMTDEMIHSKEPNGELSYNFGVILNYLFRVDCLENIMAKKMPLHVVEKKIPYVNKDGELIKPETPNGYKFEMLVLDMIKLMDDCLSYEVVRNKEFAPVKNKTGVDSIDTARALLIENGIQF